MARPAPNPHTWPLSWLQPKAPALEFFGYTNILLVGVCLFFFTNLLGDPKLSTYPIPFPSL